MNNLTLSLLASCAIFTISNHANSQFSDPNSFSWPGHYKTELFSTDTDGDGDIDFFTSSNLSGPTIIENRGDNSFDPPHPLTDYEEGHTDAAMIDVDGDGDPDFITLKNDEGTIQLFTNNGGNDFSQSLILDAGGLVWDVTTGDIDGDGDQDIAFRLNLSDVRWLENDGDGAFEPHTVVSGLSGLSKYHHFDADGDGDLDACVFNNFSDLVYCENLGDSFAAPLLIDGSADNLSKIISIDEDEDGDLDIIYATPIDGGSLQLLENTGGGTFAAPILFTEILAPVLFSPVDIDLDGKLDVVLTDYVGESNFQWMKNLGDGNFSELTPVINCYGYAVANFTDFNFDGNLDIVQILHTGSIVFYKGEGDGEFIDYTYLSETTLEPYSSLALDVDLDGDLDLFCGSKQDRKLSWVENLGDGDFSRLKLIDHGTLFSPLDITSGDLDGDGFEDLVVISFNEGKIFSYKNLGDGTFGERNLIAEIANPFIVLAEDWDNDGDIDIFASTSVAVEMKVYENTGGGVFDPSGITVVESDWANSANAHDLDNDGDMDILYSSSFTAQLRWLENTGDLSFALHTIVDDGTFYDEVTAADLDEDGDLDVLCTASFLGEVQWIENLGEGVFGATDALITGSEYPVIPLFKDMNNDEVPDLLVASRSDDVIGWYENIGDMEFDDLNIITDHADHVEELIAEDLDSDGDMDVVSISIVDNQFEWFENMHYSNHAVKGKIFHDENENGILDDDEIGVNYTQALAAPESYFAFTSASGHYNLAFDGVELGDYEIYPDNIPYWYVTTESSYDVTIDGVSTLYEGLDFGIARSEYVNEVDAHLTGGVPRIDTEVNYWINYSNIGSTTPQGMIHLQLDDSLTYLSSEITPELVEGQDIYWSYDELDYFEDRGFNVTVLMPNFESIGDDIRSYVTIEVDSMGTTLFTHLDSLDQIVQGAYDPNDKQVKPAGEGEFGYIPPTTETLEYLVRFQNTGTDTAFLVIIKDQLDPNLDWTTLEPLAWSHDMAIEVSHSGEISFIFEDIMLPDSNVNQLASNGFVKFQIDLLPDLPLGTAIYNTADIYFDANPAVVTNTTVSTLYLEDPSSIIENEKALISVYPNPFSDFTTIRFGEELTTEHTIIVYDLLGTEVYRIANIKGNTTQINKVDLGSGLFILTVINQENNAPVFSTRLLTE